VPRRDWYAVPLCLLPLGAGQFYHHEPVSGITLALLQGGCLAASIISYVKRDDHYDPRYGWYAGNAGAYRDYTTAYRIEFSVFGLAYLCGVVEALVRESRHPAAARERTR
jgi:hypothetical protein